MEQLKQHQSDVDPVLKDRWENHGFKTNGSWDEIFEAGAETDELFMAWQYACYVDEIAAAGKAEYPLPMFVNAWLSSLESVVRQVFSAMREFDAIDSVEPSEDLPPPAKLHSAAANCTRHSQEPRDTDDDWIYIVGRGALDHPWSVSRLWMRALS